MTLALQQQHHILLFELQDMQIHTTHMQQSHNEHNQSINQSHTPIWIQQSFVCMCA